MADVTINDYLIVLSGIKDFKKAVEFTERALAEGKVTNFEHIEALRNVLAKIYRNYNGNIEDADRISEKLNIQCAHLDNKWTQNTVASLRE